MNERTTMPGYTYGTSALATSPVTLDEFELMKKTALFGDEDIKIPALLA